MTSLPTSVLVICGSTAEPSHTRTLLLTIAAALKLRGAEPVWYDLREHILPIADPRYHHSPMTQPSEAVRDLVDKTEAASGFVLGTPVYHNSYSGVLKNCLDHLTIRQFANKPVALAGHGGRSRSVQPCDHLRIVVRSLHGRATIAQVVTADADYEFTAKYEITDRSVLRRVTRLADELLQEIELRGRFGRSGGSDAVAPGGELAARRRSRAARYAGQRG